MEFRETVSLWGVAGHVLPDVREGAQVVAWQARPRARSHGVPSCTRRRQPLRAAAMDDGVALMSSSSAQMRMSGLVTRELPSSATLLPHFMYSFAR